MPSSETALCNLALAHLGEAPLVTLSDSTTVGRACNLVYATTRDGLLREHRWNFARDRATLSQLAEAPAFGWDHQYQLPSDFLRMLEFNDAQIGDVISSEFEIEGTKLLTDEDTAEVIYIKRVTDVSLFDALFVEAIALKLAVKLSEIIKGTTSKTAELMQTYTSQVLPKARRIDANESRRRKRNVLPMNSEAIRARGCGI